MRALEAPELWKEVLFETGHNGEVDESKVVKFRAVFFPDYKIRSKDHFVNIDFDIQEINKALEQNGSSKAQISYSLGKSRSFFGQTLKKRKVRIEYVQLINDKLGGNYIEVVEDCSII